MQLPSWAAGALAELKVPADYITVSDTTLSNGLRLIVKTDPTSPTVSVLGSVKHNADLQTPAGQEGVSDLLGGLFSYGTQTLDRLAFQKALDDIAANESAGFSFSVKILKDNFLPRRSIAGGQRTSSRAAGAGLRCGPETNRTVCCRQSAEPGLPDFACARSGVVARRRPGIAGGTPATVGNVTLNEVKQYHAATIRPDLTTIVVIGDVSPEKPRGN